jgi:hypothetical protein
VHSSTGRSRPGVYVKIRHSGVISTDQSHMQLDEVDKIKAKRHAEDHINNIAPEDLGY